MAITALNPRLLPRPRLLDKLQDAVQRKLTLISGPPGYGKSVLARQFAAQSAVPVVWHPVAHYERDLPTLCSQSINALEHTLPDTPTIPTPSMPHEFATVLAEYLRKLNKKIIYVLDDIHHLEGADSAERWLQTFVSLLPTNCHLMLIGRTIPPLSLVELIARQEVVSIGPAELRLNRDEIHALASGALERNVSEEQLDILEGDLEGWPIGVMLALDQPADTLRQFILQGQNDPEILFNVLAGRMFSTQSPALQEFLLTSSVMHGMTPDLLQSILGLHNSAELLNEVWIHNLFINQSQGILYYHTLLRRFLQAQLRQVNALKFIDLHLKAARWFEAENHIAAAVEHYLAAEQFSYAAALADDNAQVYFVQGKTETLLTWKALLEQVQQPSARVLYGCALIHTNRLNYALSDLELAQAAALLKSANDYLLHHIAIQQAHNMLKQGQPREAEARLLPILEMHPQPSMIRGRALWVMGSIYAQLGQREQAAAYLLEAVSIYRKLASQHALSQVLHTLAMVYEQLGRLAQASACLQECIALLRALGIKQDLAMALNDLGYYFYLGNNYEQARNTYEDALQLIAHIPDPRAETYLLWNIGDLKRDTGDFEGAARAYHKALAVLNKADAALYSYLLLSIALLRYRQGKRQEVIDLSSEVIQITDESLVLQRSVGQVLYWVVRAELEKSPLCLQNVDTALDNLRKQQANIKLLSALILAAQAALTCAGKTKAKLYVQEALQLSNTLNIVQPLAVELAHLPDVRALSIISNQSELVAAVETLLHHPAKDATHPSTPTLSLRAITLGKCTIARNGKQISGAEWRSGTARILFCYLLFQGPSHRDTIMVNFWPDSPLAVARSNFHTTLKRARKALGSAVIMLSDEVYMLNEDVHLWCDAFEFESLITQANQLPIQDARTEALFNRALQLYKGELLAEVQQEWIRPWREKYHELYIETILGLANAVRSRGDYTMAIRLLKRGLAVEPYHETLHRQLLQCYADKGEKRKVLKHYSALQQLLKHDLGIQPDSSTQQLFQQIMN